MNPAVMVALNLLTGASDPGSGGDVPLVRQRAFFRFVWSRVWGRVN